MFTSSLKSPHTAFHLTTSTIDLSHHHRYDKSRFSVIQYSDSPRLEFALNEYLSMEELMNAIDGIPYQGGNTNTGQALKFSLYTALSPSNGARPYVSKVAMILTDGRSQDLVANPAHELRQAGVKVSCCL